MKYTRKVLPNGLTVLTVPSNDAESVVVDFFIKTGSRSETARESGISHFLEHFLFKGTEKYPSAMAITELIDSIGAEMNANTGKEHTQYYIKAQSSHLDLIFEVLTEMLQRPILDAGELEREKGVIVEELNMYRDVPMVEIENVLENAMWPGQSLGRNIVGSQKTVTKFTPAMFRSYLARNYQPGNMILGISGKFDQKQVNFLIKKYWSAVKKSRFDKWQPVVDRQNGLRVELEYKKTQQAHLALAFKGLSSKDPKNPTALVLATILGGGMSSRLFYEIRERRGLAYYIRSSSSNYQDTGAFQISAGVQVDKIEEAVKVIAEELKRIRAFLVDPKELHKAKEYLKGRNTLALEDSQSRLDWVVEQEAFHPEIWLPKTLFQKIDAVTAKDVRAMAKFLFNYKKATLAVLGPYRSDAPFKKLLK
jgi:predicted Zn-dependent peptidase